MRWRAASRMSCGLASVSMIRGGESVRLVWSERYRFGNGFRVCM